MTNTSLFNSFNVAHGDKINVNNMKISVRMTPVGSTSEIRNK